MGKQFTIGPELSNNVNVSLDGDMLVIAGPCIIEGEQICLDIARRLVEISGKTEIQIIFKASFDKANRSSIDSFRGPGLEKGLEILSLIREQTKLPLVTDILYSANTHPHLNRCSLTS